MTVLNVTIYHLNFKNQNLYLHNNNSKSILKEYFISSIFIKKFFQTILYSACKGFSLLTIQLLHEMVFFEYVTFRKKMELLYFQIALPVSSHARALIQSCLGQCTHTSPPSWPTANRLLRRNHPERPRTHPLLGWRVSPQTSGLPDHLRNFDTDFSISYDTYSLNRTLLVIVKNAIKQHISMNTRIRTSQTCLQNSGLCYCVHAGRSARASSWLTVSSHILTFIKV